MSFGIANSFVAAQAPQGSGETAAPTPSERTAEAAVQSLKAYKEAPPSGGAERTERADAVKATPTNAPATVVDFNSAKSSSEMPEYPISGPDEFARSMAVKNAAPAEEAEQPQDDIERVADLEARAAEVKAATSGESDLEAVEKTWKAGPGPAKTDDLQLVKSDQARFEAQEALERASQDVRETAAEAGEARLVE